MQSPTLCHHYNIYKDPLQQPDVVSLTGKFPLNFRNKAPKWYRLLKARIRISIKDSEAHSIPAMCLCRVNYFFLKRTLMAFSPLVVF